MAPLPLSLHRRGRCLHPFGIGHQAVAVGVAGKIDLEQKTARRLALARDRHREFTLGQSDQHAAVVWLTQIVGGHKRLDRLTRAADDLRRRRIQGTSLDGADNDPQDGFGSAAVDRELISRLPPG